MERLTKRTANGVAYMAIADTLAKEDQEIEGSKPILEGLYAMFQKLADYEDETERSGKNKSKYINEERLKSDTLEMSVEDLEDKTEELAGRLLVMQMKLSDGGSYDDVIKFCEVLLQLKAIETFCDDIKDKEKSS